MMKKTLLAALFAVLGLSGCNSISGKTPQEMMQISMARSLKQDYSYNFSGDARVYLSDQKDGVAPETAAKSVLQADKSDVGEGAAVESDAHDTDTAAMSDEVYAKTMSGDAALLKGLAGKAVEVMQEYPVLPNYLQNGRLKISGAVDLRKELIEITPELVLAGRNEQLAVKMPLLFNGEDMSVTADLPDSIALMLNFLVGPEIRERLIREPVRFTLPEEDKKGIPVRNALNAFVYATYKAYGELPPEAFRLKEMDRFGKKAGSRYRLELVMTSSTTRAYYDAMLREFTGKLNELEQSSPEAGTTPEGYEKMRKMSRGLVALAKLSDTEKIYGSPVFISFYLNGKGRLMGMRQYVQLNGSNNKALNIDSGVKLYNFGKPVFTFKPQAAKTISFKELTDAVRKQTKAKYSQRYGKQKVDVADIEVPSQPNVIEEKVLSK